MTRTARAVGGAAFGYLHQVLMLGVGLWLTPFFLGRVGQHQYGLWLVAGQILGYLALLDLGVLAILPREVAATIGRTGQVGTAHLGSLVAQVHRILRWQVPLLAVSCGVVWFLLPTAWSELRWPLVVVFVAFIAFYGLRVPAAVLQGTQELTFLARTQMLGWAMGTGLTIALVLAGAGLYALTIGWSVTLAAPAMAAWVLVRRRWPALASVPQPEESVRAYFARSLWVSVSQVAQVLLAGSDVLVLGALAGPAAVVPYACTGKLVTVFSNQPQLLMHMAQPALTELRASGQGERLKTVSTALTQAMLLMSGALSVTIAAANGAFVHWWVGPSQYSGQALTLAFVAMMVVRHCSVSVTYTLFCFGYEKQISLTAIGDGLVTVASAVLLIWAWGPIGAPLGSLLGALLVSLPLNIRSVSREMGASPLKWCLALGPLVAAILTATAAATVAATLLGGGGLVGAAAVTAAALLLYGALVLPIVRHGAVAPYVALALAPLRRRLPWGPPVRPSEAR